MATNLKGKGRFVSMLLLHGEKIAIALIGFVALWFVYKALKIEKLDDKFQAEKLQNEITQTSSEVKNYTWDKAIADDPTKVKKAYPITEKVEPVRFEDYVPRDGGGKPSLAFDESIVAPLILRDDPVLLNVVDVRAVGGSGLFAFVDEEIRKKQALKLAEEAAEADKKAAEKLKKEAKIAAENTGGKTRNRGPEGGPGVGLNEPIDPAHPKRRLLVNTTGRPIGNILQGGERIERAYWACVTAKVPIREQLKRFQDALEKARGADPTRDFPGYVGYFVERAEVLPGKELEWKAVPLYDGQRDSIAQGKSITTGSANVVAKPAFDKLVTAAQSFWAGGLTPDVIDERFSQFPLTLPLPPLVGREWGADATHPDIPLAINTPPLEDDTAKLAAEAAAKEAAKADAAAGEFGTALPTQGQGFGPGVGPGPGQSFGPGQGYGPGRPGGEYAGPGGGFGRRFGGPEAMMGRGGMGPEGMGPGGRRFMGGSGAGPEGGAAFRGGGGGAGQVAPEHTFLPKGVDYYLLRFFDFTVEPGKKYKYRVKLVLKDPNFNMPQGVLSPAVLDRQAKEAVAAKKKKSEIFYRIVDKWSDATPAVGIPMAGNVRLADIKIPQADRFNDEPTAKMLVEAFDVDDAGTPIQAVTDPEKNVFRRGYVANLIQDGEYQPDPTMVDTQPNFKFLTGMTVLDVDGGAKIGRDMTSPSRMLVMGPAGELYIRNELDDKPYVDSRRVLFEKTNDKRGNPLNPEMGPGGMGPGGRGARPPRR